MSRLTRTQLSLYVPVPVNDQLETIRRVLDPVQSVLIPAHVTLCREDEIADLNSARIRSRLEAHKAGPIALRFGPAEAFQGHGILLPCIGGENEFQTLRECVLGSKVIRHQKAHITLAHPRNPRSANNHVSVAADLLPDVLITFPSIRMIRQCDSEPWQVLEEFRL